MTERVVVVTGASAGIGLATARLFKTSGWRVVGAARREPPADATDRSVITDVGDPDAVTRLFESVAEREGHLTALVNNAAVQICKPFGELTLTDWDQVMDVNLRGVFWSIRQALPLLRSAQGDGAVVNVGSVHALATSRQIAAYATSKGGLTALTRAAALDLAPEGVRVNAVLPGAVDTTMLRDGLSRGHVGDQPMDQMLETFGQRHVMKRVGQPNEIAQAILYLADTTRSGYVTGTTLVVDGGVTAALSTEVD